MNVHYPDCKLSLNDGVQQLVPSEILTYLLGELGRGASIEDIAAQLYLSKGTVRNHISTAIQSLIYTIERKPRILRENAAGYTYFGFH